MHAQEAIQRFEDLYVDVREKLSQMRRIHSAMLAEYDAAKDRNEELEMMADPVRDGVALGDRLGDDDDAQSD